MTIEQFESANDFTLHDASLRSVSRDLAQRTAEFILDICVGNPEAKDHAEREKRRRGRIHLASVDYLIIEPPDPSYPYREAGALWIDSSDADENVAAAYPSPPGNVSGRFFVSDWNSFIHFSAGSATFTWLEPHDG